MIQNRDNTPNPISLDLVIQARRAPFTASDLTSVRGLDPTSENTLQALATNDLLLYDPYEEDPIFYPRASFFNGCSFLIRPTADELDLQVLFPGHRFIPFLSMRTLPRDATLLWDGTYPLEKKIIRCPLNDAMLYHSLFGLHAACEYFIADQESNRWLESDSPPEEQMLDLTVFDLSSRPEGHPLREGCSLLCRVIDWAEGIYTVEPASGGYEDCGGERLAVWCDALDEALRDVLLDELASPIINEQFAYAFFAAEAYVSRMPAIHLGGYLEYSQSIGLTVEEGHSFLWPTDTDEDAMPDFLEDDDFPADLAAYDSPFEDPLDVVLDELGLSLNAVELRAYMRDALYNDIRDLRKVKSRCFAGRDIQFISEDQKKFFTNAIAREWRDLKDEYNLFADHACSELRGSLLVFNDKILAHLRSLDRADIPMKDIPREVTHELGELSALISRILELLEQPQSDTKELDALSETVKKLNEPIEDLIQRARRALESKGYKL